MTPTRNVSQLNSQTATPEEDNQPNTQHKAPDWNEAKVRLMIKQRIQSSSLTVLYFHKNRMDYRDGERMGEGMRAQAHLPVHTAPDSR